MQQETRSTEQVLAGIQALELDCIKLKLMDAEQGEGWSREYAEQMEVAYKRFLTLMVKYPDDLIAPTMDVDTFWHGHILDTMKYAEDCERVFGYFLHHFPYLGMRGEEDAALQATAAARLHALYEHEFGEALPAQSAWCAKAKPGSAWCAKARPESAWCAKARAESAWCAKARAESAWCAKASAWCAKASPDRLNVKQRPGMAAVS
jgi:hypothetical protein